MFIIADAHVSEAESNTDAFFEMLAGLAETEADIVFLGDIFDLWVSLPRYETEMETRFLDWCRREKQRRTIGFIEGNHEFYVVRHHRDCFTWSSERGRREGGLLINRADRQYLWWRRLSKNLLARTFARLWRGGPQKVAHLKEKMKNTNRAFRGSLPAEALAGFAHRGARQGLELILVGHFHEPFAHTSGSCRLVVLPDWYSAGEIGYLDAAEGRLETGHWRELSARARGSRTA